MATVLGDESDEVCARSTVVVGLKAGLFAEVVGMGMGHGAIREVVVEAGDPVGVALTDTGRIFVTDKV